MCENWQKSHKIGLAVPKKVPSTTFLSIVDKKKCHKKNIKQ
jgi:hypothetical protein